jgi:protein TonB
VAASHSETAPLPQPLHLGGELSVSCSERPAPAYPKQSLRLGEQGKTVLLVELDELGRMITVEVKTKSGFPRLDEAALNAVRTWRCTPAKHNGIAVRSIALQPFNFTLKGR